MSKDLSSISIVVPVYQCAARLGAHLETLEPLASKVRELIWVITESPDRSCEIARRAATRLGGRVLTRPRGLYEAWNAGVAAAKGEFIYISTAGDFLIHPGGLSILHELLEKTAADAVISPPQLHAPSLQVRKTKASWPLFVFTDILQAYAAAVIPSPVAARIQILSGASGLTGSYASCLFRTSTLRQRPFPLNFHHYGDTAWLYRHLPDIRLAYCPTRVARFEIHGGELRRKVDKDQIYGLIMGLAEHLPEAEQTWVNNFIRASKKIDAIRDPHPKIGWWLYPDAWRQRILRDWNRWRLMRRLKEVLP
jgi:glycosyltransferase involved in cell wall biosynthesis